MKRLLWISVAIGLLTVAGVIVAGLLLRRPESTPAIRGRQLAQQLGCFACHGPEGAGGIADPTAPGGEVPDWQYATVKLFVQSEQDIRDWILLGAPSREAQRQDQTRHHEQRRGSRAERRQRRLRGLTRHALEREAPDLEHAGEGEDRCA